MLGSIHLEFLAKPVQNSFNRQKIEIKGLYPDITVGINLPNEIIGPTAHTVSLHDVIQTSQRLGLGEHKAAYDKPMREP